MPRNEEAAQDALNQHEEANDRPAPSSLVGQFSAHFNAHASTPITPLTSLPAGPERVRLAWVLPLLKTIPMVLAMAFATSFWWDFQGVFVVVWDYSLQMEGFMRTLSVSGLIGYLTNWLAITMLFHPRERRPVWGQGLIPAQRDRVIDKLARAISDDLVTADALASALAASGMVSRFSVAIASASRSALADPSFRHQLRTAVRDGIADHIADDAHRRTLTAGIVDHLDQLATDGLSNRLVRWLQAHRRAELEKRIDRLIDRLPDMLSRPNGVLDTWVEQLPALWDHHADATQTWATHAIKAAMSTLDVHGMITTNMQSFEDKRLETLIKSASNDQLDYIRYIGAVLGMMGGLVIFDPVSALLALGGLTIVLGVADVLLDRMRSA